MKNKYTFTATQVNDNDILGGLFALLGAYIGLILVIGLIAIGMVYVLGKTALEVIKIPWFWVALVILTLAGIGVGIYFAVRPTTTTTNTNPSGQPPSPPPLDPWQPGPNEIKCDIGNMAGCKCSYFVTDEAADKLTEEQKKQKCAPFIEQLQTSLTDTISKQCNSINVQWGDPPTKFNSTFCNNTQVSNCSRRTFSSQSGTRSYCTSPDGSTALPALTTVPALTTLPAI